MNCERLDWDLLVRAVDKELSPAEEQLVETHLGKCAQCRREFAEVAHFSRKIAEAVNDIAVVEDSGDRERLAAQINRHELLKPVRQIAPAQVMRRFGWGMAIAATLALGIIFAPKQSNSTSGNVSVRQQASVASAIEVDGETFVALPYSNPDLPASAPRIVQMQVPVSSLADIGIAMTPVSNVVLNQDRSVLADVLLGADGQPLGVHVVSWE
jgi:anti-sigma factor RsiW